MRSFDSSDVLKIEKILKVLPQQYQVNLAKYLVDQSSRQLYIATLAGEPRYCLGTVNWLRMPAFSLLDLRSFEPSGRTFLHRSILNQLFAHAFEVMHRDHRFTFYYATRLRNEVKRMLKSGSDFAPVRGLELFENYDFTIEAVVRAGQHAKFEYQTHLLDFQNRNSDYLIKRGTLRMPFVAPFLGMEVCDDSQHR